MINRSDGRILRLLLSLPVLATLVFVVIGKGAVLGEGAVPGKDTFPAGAYVSGDFTVAFSSDGIFRVSEKGDAVVDGNYTVEADRITLTDKQGRYACVAEGPGKYTWKQTGQTLAFTKVDDRCPGRERILTTSLCRSGRVSSVVGKR